MTSAGDGGAALVAGRARDASAEVRNRAGAAWDALGAGRAVEDGIRAHLARVLWRLLGPHVRDQGRLWRAGRPGGGWSADDATEDEGFAAYLGGGGWTALDARLPRLEPLVASVLAHEVAATAEVLARAAHDAPALGTGLGDGRDPGPLTGMAPGLSDPHHRRRYVAALSFAGGLRVVYKPRSVAMEAGLAATLDWLRAYGPLDLPGGLDVLERDGYGWCAFVEGRACASRDEVGLHFRRLGSLAAVLAALATTDCHADNFVARGPDPMLVDAETLLHPRLLASPGFSLRETEIVPSEVVGPAGQRIDYPGYDGEPGGVGGPTSNLPRWNGRAQHLRDHRGPFGEGVAAARRVLSEQGEALAGAGGPLGALAHCRARVVLRPTALYGALLVHLVSAAALGREDGGWGRVEQELTRYRDPVLSAETWAVVQRAEGAALARGDVPYLVADTTTGDLHDADGTLLAAGAFVPVLPGVLTSRTCPG